MPYATFNRSTYPLITVTFTGEPATGQNFNQYLAELSNNYNRGETIKILFDARQAKFPPLKYQKMQAEWLKTNEHLMKEQCSGIVYVIPNMLIRKALNLIFSIQPQPVPLKVLKSTEDALKWLNSI